MAHRSGCERRRNRIYRTGFRGCQENARPLYQIQQWPIGPIGCGRAGVLSDPLAAEFDTCETVGVSQRFHFPARLRSSAFAGACAVLLALTPSVALAHGTDAPKPSVSALLTRWEFDPVFILVAGGATWWYVSTARAVSKAHPASPWPKKRLAYFLSGIGVMAFAVTSPIFSYDGVLFAGPAVPASAFADDVPRPAVLARFGVGYDTVDLDACTARGVAVTSVTAHSPFTFAPKRWCVHWSVRLPS